MEFSRLSSPPSIHVHDCHPVYDRQSPEPFYPTKGAMRIPSKGVENYAPPPLPPPRRISDLDQGHDAGWLYANSVNSATLPPISPTSSLAGGHHRPGPFLSSGLEKNPSDVSDRRFKSHESTRHNLNEVHVEPPRYIEDGLRNSLSTTLSEPILEGERNFSRRSVKSSSDAYDQHLLSKIGKSNSPPKSLSSIGSEPPSGITSLPFHLRKSRPSPPFLADGLSNGQGQCQSGPVSPQSKSGWKDYIGIRSPSVENSTISGYETDSFGREFGRHQAASTSPSYPLLQDDISSLPSRSHRGSYDQAAFADADGDFIADESGPFRQLQISDGLPPYLDGPSKQQHGLKRRASSPPRELANYDRHGFQNASNPGDSTTQRRYPSFHNPMSSSPRYPQAPGSFSSLSSASLRTSGSSISYSSALSIGASSMTSMSSGDRHSPGGVSPKSDLDYCLDKPSLNQTGSSPISNLGFSCAGIAQLPTSLESKAAPQFGRKLPTQNSSNGTKSSPPKPVGMYVCECCPKKPKKFDTHEELRTHASEKQYSCQFCSNRFKNKNEAERHQNSLHLRRHSWSCAALSSFKAAFHSSSAPNIPANGVASHDTCGYCGEEFPNFPRPDWDRRYEHLANVHKFGDCNNVKKFYRADHFRQHLKHTHAGTTGKWTNILESACMKEEPPVEAKLGSIGEEHSYRSSDPESAVPSISKSLASSTIDESVDES
jgi:hypothetical protein